MHVVQIITELRPAGAERVLADLSRGLVARRHQVSVVSLMPLPLRSPILDELAHSGVHIHTLGLDRAHPWRAFRLRGLLSTLRPSLVHSHLLHPNILARWSAPAAYPLVSTVHLVERRSSKRWLLLLDRWTHRRSDRVTAVSRAVQTFHARVLGVQPETIAVISNGVRPPHHPDPEEIANLRREWGVDTADRVLGSVGRLDRQKGYDRLLRMLPQLSSLVPPGKRWGLVILGDGSQGDALRRLAERAPDSWIVRFPGYRSDAAAAAGAFDLFLMPSRFEGYGLALVEAMSHGLPVVASDVDSLPELLLGYDRGRLVSFDASGVASVRAAIEELLTMPGTGSTRSAYPVEAMVEAYLELYTSILAARGLQAGSGHPA